MVGQDEIVQQLDTFEGKPPHLFFCGPPGCGKTTAAMAMAHKSFGKEWKKNTLFQNASDERGIDVIRDKIKTFAKTRGVDSKYKIVILDESDNITRDGQLALKGIIEDNERNCSFILTANEESDVIPAIKDRCNQFFFKPIEDESTKELIKIICDNENIDLPKDLYDLLIQQSNGSMRRILYNLENFSKLNRTITKKDFNTLPINDINELIKNAFNGTSEGFIEARKIGMKMVKGGTSVKTINKIIFERIHKSKFSEPIKAKMFIYLQETDRNISTGAVPEAQLVGLLSNFFLLTYKLKQ